MTLKDPPVTLRIGSVLLALSSLGLLAAPVTIVAAIPDLTTRASRHAFAGALGLTAIAVLEFILALIPIRRGERWAVAAAAIPFLIVGLPIFVVDATHVARGRLFNTLAPQALGLVLGTTALTLCALGTRGAGTQRSKEFTMRKNALLGLLALVGLTVVSTVSGTPEPGVVGTWRLVSNDEHRQDGTVTAVWGSNPGGRLMYDAGGRMAVQLMDPRRGNFASEDRLAGTPDEMRQAFQGYLAYFGTYSVDVKAGVVVHHVEGSVFPNLIGTDQRRSFVLTGNRLTLTTPPIVGGGRRSTYVLVWEREG